MSQDPHRLAKALRDYGTGQMPNHNLVMLLLNDEDLDSFYYSEFAF
jgi:hypothetical protein